MENQLINNPEALRLFFNEDVFLVQDKDVQIPDSIVFQAVSGHEDSAEEKNSLTEKTTESVVIPRAYSPNTSENPVLEEPITPRIFKYLGGNQKSVLILVNDSDHDVSTAEGRELLRKIVKSVELATPDFALLNYANYSGVDFAELKSFFKPKLLLSFGVEISALKLNLSWQNEIILHDEVRMIFAPNLHALDADINGKKALWGNLKKI
ncbi:hypothetical protein ACJVDH_16640 [Pedobacter sp. AW1-32]|uniref:hypothetical protein n=1 Tax=Pedobacter sp. AW1-32 TaxID=3383026 RepID=UPI003FF0B1F6